MSTDNDKKPIRIEDEQFHMFSTGVEHANNWQIKKTRVKKSAYQRKGKTFLTLQFPFRPGDRFMIGGYCNLYYIVSHFKYAPYGGYIFEIKKADGSDMLPEDLDVLKKGAWAQVKGYFNNKTCKIK